MKLSHVSYPRLKPRVWVFPLAHHKSVWFYGANVVLNASAPAVGAGTAFGTI